MRVIGLTLAGAAINRHLGFKFPVEDQAETIRNWARERNHEILAMYDCNSAESLWRTEEALHMRSIRAAILPADRLADFATYPFLAPLYPLTSPRFVDRVIAADTNQVLQIRKRQEEAHRRVDPRYWPARSERFSRRPPQIDLMKEGRRRKHDSGGYAYGAPPYGWVAVEGGLAPDSREQETLSRALQLRGDALSLRAICEVLDAEGHRTRRGKPWSSGALSRILDRPAPPPESIVQVNVFPWPRLRDGRRSKGRLKLRWVGERDQPDDSSRSSSMDDEG